MLVVFLGGIQIKQKCALNVHVLCLIAYETDCKCWPLLSCHAPLSSKVLGVKVVFRAVQLAKENNELLGARVNLAALASLTLRTCVNIQLNTIRIYTCKCFIIYRC